MWRRPVNPLAAHVPVGLMQYEDQVKTPGELEQEFATALGSANIPQNYLETIENMFRAFEMLCDVTYSGRPERVLSSAALVVRLTVTFENVYINRLAVRPCFEGYQLGSILIYQMLKIAGAYWKKKVIFRNCGSHLVKVLESRYKGFFSVVPGYDNPALKDCVFTLDQLHTVLEQKTAKLLGFGHKVSESLHAEATTLKGAAGSVLHIPEGRGPVYDRLAMQEYCLLKLNADAFPRAFQLNTAKYVNNHYAQVLQTRKNKVAAAGDVGDERFMYQHREDVDSSSSSSSSSEEDEASMAARQRAEKRHWGSQFWVKREESSEEEPSNDEEFSEEEDDDAEVMQLSAKPPKRTRSGQGY